MVENGIKPCYVFDGKPPKLKSGEVSFVKLDIRQLFHIQLCK
jgi:5'-3' exonuclease